MIYFIISAILIIADQLTKFAALKYLKPLGTKEIISGMLSLTYVENRGAAFGIMQNARWLFIVFTIAVVAAAVAYTIRTKQTDKSFLISVSPSCSQT